MTDEDPDDDSSTASSMKPKDCDLQDSMGQYDL